MILRGVITLVKVNLSTGSPEVQWESVEEAEPKVEAEKAEIDRFEEARKKRRIIAVLRNRIDM